jgi:hypothetical protein
MLTCEKYCHKICLPSRYANSLFQPEWVHLPYAEIHIQRPFFDMQKVIWKILRLKIQKMCSYFGDPSTHGSFYLLKKTKISIFGGISKFLDLIVFGQILAILGNFLAHFATLAVADSMPKDHLKS